MTKEEQLKSVVNAIDSLQHKDKHDRYDLAKLSNLRLLRDKLYIEIHGEPERKERVSAPFIPLEVTLAAIREHFKARHESNTNLGENNG